MGEYKRLTDSETAVMLKNTEGSSWDSEDMGAQRYIRLAEIEDKIENGTLIELNKPYIILNYVSNGKEYYSICMAKEEELHINLTKAEAEEKLKELKGEV